MKWSSMRAEEFKTEPNLQPYFKLHGSVNWAAPHGGGMLVMGGNKLSDMSLHPVLMWYAQRFDEYLNQPNTRLMVIGYGFGDRHINDVIVEAHQKSGLETFIVDLAGVNVFKAHNPSRSGAIYAKQPIDEISVIGASRRPIRETFSGDELELGKLTRFFRTA